MNYIVVLAFSVNINTGVTVVKFPVYVLRTVIVLCTHFYTISTIRDDVIIHGASEQNLCISVTYIMLFDLLYI